MDSNKEEGGDQEEPFQQKSWLPDNIEEFKKEIADSPDDLAALQFLMKVREESHLLD